MLEAALPENEDERLHALYYIGILDTPIEERFERITRLVCNILDVPIAAISLIDKDRQWFKSIQGLNEFQTPRSVAFCAHAILDDEMLVVEDATHDARFSQNPLVLDNPSIRFYAGQPLSLASNLRLGTLCAIDSRPRELTPREANILRDLGRIAESEMQLLLLNTLQNDMMNAMERQVGDSQLDPVTRLWNYHGTLTMVERAWSNAVNAKTPIGFVHITIDKAAGQDGEMFPLTMIEASRRLLRALSDEDKVGRWWGEDSFMAVLRGDSFTELNTKIHLLKKELEATPAPGGVRIQARIGAMHTGAPRPNEMHAFIARVEEEQQRAKGSTSSPVYVSWL